MYVHLSICIIKEKLAVNKHKLLCFLPSRLSFRKSPSVMRWYHQIIFLYKKLVVN